MTITTVTPSKVAAGQANRVILINGTNFDEDQITGITLGSDPDCANLQSYVVTSATQISVKTPAAVPAASNPATAAPGCVATTGAAEDVTVLQVDASGATGSVTKSAAVTFVPPPSLTALVTTAGSEAYPAYTENSAELTDATKRVRDLTTAGGQAIRIKASGDFAFSGATSAGLSGTLGGKPLTTVGFLTPLGATQAATAAGDAGNYWIARTGTALTASATPTLSITQGTVTRNFVVADHGLTIVATPVVTSLDVNSGKVNAATTVKITGTGFSGTPADLSVTFCGVAAPTPTASTLTSITVTTPTTVSGTAGTGLGTATAGVCPVVVTKGGVSSPVTSSTYFAFLDR
ncbi:IPT/TIG domain-containing protein [Symbioplanes lichenis]|uniref:IPT/TIG domain-containing protein n=1 Tax=Symbioplanes lichenis TaxID=1629072 RepID=UPI002738F748|nr:IPT/TIG domain-containing protein [Actinoplanes lichenis]